MDTWAGRKLLNSTAPEPDKSVWQKIEEFYDDKNNFAMFLVLPMLVIVYGGCSLIYCIAKCRRRFKKKKHKKMTKFVDEKDEEDDEPITDRDRHRRDDPSQDRRGGKQTSTSDVRVGMERENSGTPLPWQVPDDKESLYPQKNPPRKPRNGHPSPPPPYDDADMIPMQKRSMNRPMMNTVSNPGNDNNRNLNAMESYAMAKQAAELLRQDAFCQPIGPGYKKQRRMVFVAEWDV